MSAETKYRIRAIDETRAGTRSAERNFLSVDKAVGTLRGGIAGLGAALGVGALVSFAHSLLETAGELTDLSKATGISASKLSELQYAAKLGGVELQGLGTALRFMERGISKGDDIFKRMGLSVEDLRRQAPDEAFLTIADAIANLRSEYDRTEAAMAVFGRGGAEILPVIEAGSQAIRELGEHAKATGAALTDKAVASLDAAGDQLDAVGAQFRGLATGLLTEVGPAFVWVVKNIGIGIADLVYDFKKANTELWKLAAGIDQFLESAPLGSHWKDYWAYNRQWYEEAAKLFEKDLAGGKLAHRERFMAIELPEISGLKERTGELKNLKDAADAAKKAERELAQAQREAEQIIEGTLTADEEWQRGHDRARQLFDAGRLSEEQYERRIRQLDQTYREATTSVKTFGDELERTFDLQRQGGRRRPLAPPKEYLTEWGEFFGAVKVAAADAMQDVNYAVTDALFEMHDALAVLRDFAVDVFRQIAAAMVGEYITGPILASVGLGKRAGGGPVSAFQPYLVGERGPELFVPAASGTVVPNHNLSPGRTINLYVTVQAIDAQSSLQFLARNVRPLGAMLQRELGFVSGSGR